MRKAIFRNVPGVQKQFQRASSSNIKLKKPTSVSISFNFILASQEEHSVGVKVVIWIIWIVMQFYAIMIY